MTTATQIQRFSKNIKAQMHTAASKIELDGYTISADYLTITCDEDDDGSFYGMVYYRSGDELIAVPDFYIGETNISLVGSRGGEYILNDETVEAA